MGVWQSNHRVGKNHPNYKQDETITCEECGDEFDVTPSRADKATYCSESCMGSAYEGREPFNERVESIETECAQCGESLKRKPWWYNQVKRCFCSPECNNTWISENLRGENHPRWEPNLDRDYGKNWDKIRAKVVARDSGECWTCGLPNGAHRVAYNQSLHAHHVFPNNDGGENHQRNLITLCAVCHRKLEP